jgi:uncharacterized OsmC-like protein
VDFYGAGQEDNTQRGLRAGRPPEAARGQDEGPAPVEYVLYALAAGLTADIGSTNRGEEALLDAH